MKHNGGITTLTLSLLTVGLALTGLGCTGGGGSNRTASAVATGSPSGGGTSPPGGSASPGGGTAPTTTSSGGGTTTPPPSGGGTTTPPPSGGGTTTPPPSSGGGAFDAAQASIGTNLYTVTYYTPQWPFVDIMRTSRRNASGYPWDLVNPSGLPAPALDAQGYPVGLGTGQVVSTYSCIGGNHPLGEYVVLFEGDGSVEVSYPGGKASKSHDGNGTARFTMNVAQKGQFTIRITRSSAADHVRRLRIITPGHEATYATKQFHPLFLERIAPYTVLRFMDWGETNHSSLVSWSQRTTPDYRTQHGRGVAYEVMADLCNETRKQPWVCVPHQANDDFVRQLATLLRDRVDPSLKVFVEYSNEVWNSGFSQHKWVAARASAEGTTFQLWYGKRAAQVFAIFEQVFGGRSRLVRVLGTQAANTYIGQKAIEGAGGEADALAIAPYFGGSLGNADWQTTRTQTVDQILDVCAADLAKQRGRMKANADLARSKGLMIIGYEGGQHLAGVSAAAKDDATLTSLLNAANRHSRMGQLYRDYLAAWKAEGLGLFVHFQDVYTPGKHGNWGALERQDQDLSTAHKYRALVDTAAQWGSGSP